MAEQENIDQIDSSELFDSAISDDPAPQVEETVAEAEEEQPRDAQGRFKSADPEPEPEPVPAPAQVKDEDGSIPSWRMREMREERDAERQRSAGLQARLEALERQLQQNAPKPEPVDIFADPNAYMQQQLSPMAEMISQMRMEQKLELSRERNYRKHGEETVDLAEKSIEEAMLKGDPEIAGLRAKMLASKDPVGVAVEWHKSRALYQEIGGDLTSYRNRILEEALKDPAFQAKAVEAIQGRSGTQPAKTITRLPPSINRVGQSANEAADTDVSDAALFRHAMR